MGERTTCNPARDGRMWPHTGASYQTRFEHNGENNPAPRFGNGATTERLCITVDRAWAKTELKAGRGNATDWQR
eukprot:9973607-Lingulodinium_polyedra.AAC.1